MPGRLARRERAFTVGTGVGLVIVAAGLYIAMRPLGDNSFLTHLATGRLILDSGSVPSHDPYTFTATGAPWVVQSWLVSVLYASAEELAGAAGIRLLMGVVGAGIAACAWALTRDATGLVGRLALGAGFVAVAAGTWSERPMMFGLLFLAITLLAIERRWAVWPLVPIFWLWANMHGSFLLGVGMLAALSVGARLDHDDARHLLSALAAAAAGTLLAVVGPLGLQVLLFPFDLLGRQDVLRNIVEWRAPTFQGAPERAFLVLLLGAIVLLARRPTWRQTIVLVVFGGLALTSARNLPVAAIVLLPGMARGLGDAGVLKADASGLLGRALTVTGVAALVLASLGRLEGDDYRLTSRYPIASLAAIDELDIDLSQVRMAAPDSVGNLVDLLHEPRGVTFFDDRFDMFPEDVFHAHRALIDGAPRWRVVLDELDIDLVLWHRSGVGPILAADPSWRALVAESDFVLYCQRDVELSGTLRC